MSERSAKNERTDVRGRRDPARVTSYRWAPPEHPDPPENHPFGIDGVEWSTAVDHEPVTVHVEFSRTGWQDVPGFVDAAADDRAFVQFVHMGFAYREWLPLDRLTVRELKRRP